MDLLDTVAHLYENDDLEERQDSPIRQTMPMGYSYKNEFGQQVEYSSGQSRVVDTYRSTENIPCEESSDGSIDANAIVEHLDGVFRQRINTEIENFRVSVNEIVSEQQMNYRTMFGLQQDMDPSQEVPIQLYSRSSSTDNISDFNVVVENGKQNDQMAMVESPASTFNSYGTSDGEPGFSGLGPTDTRSARENENAIADKYLIRLMTATMLVGNTLRRKEYKV